MRLTAALSHEPPLYVARYLEVEVASQGGTIEDSLAHLKEAPELYFEDLPTPENVEPPIIATVELSGVSRSLPIVSGAEVVRNAPQDRLSSVEPAG